MFFRLTSRRELRKTKGGRETVAVKSHTRLSEHIRSARTLQEFFTLQADMENGNGDRRRRDVWSGTATLLQCSNLWYPDDVLTSSGQV